MPAPGKWRSYEKFPVRVPPIGIIQSSWMIIIETYGDDWGSRFTPNILWRYDKQKKTVISQENSKEP
jgi:hypothetical protein